MKAPEIRYDEEGEIDMDWWMTLTEEQVEAIEFQQEREYTEWINSLTRLQQYRLYRRLKLEHILRQREMLAKFPFLADLDTFKTDPRIGLLKLRHFLKTGVYPETN